MQQCPLCMQDVRQVGGVMLITPDQLSGESQRPPVTGAACVDCLGLLAILLDGLRGGKIRALADKLVGSGAVKRI